MRVALLAVFAFTLLPAPARSQQGLKLDSFVPAQELWAAFCANEAKGDLTYGGKLIAIEGTVRNVRKHQNGQYAVQLFINAGDPSLYFNVTCFTKDVKTLTTLEPGAEVQVKGTCRGWEARGDEGFGDVVLENCAVVKKR